jgi:hypothetical protein
MLYSKEFLVGAFASKYSSLGENTEADLWCMAWDFYDTVTKEDFRKYANLTPEILNIYRRNLNASKN